MEPLLVVLGRETLLGGHGSGSIGKQLEAGAFGTGSVHPKVEARLRVIQQRCERSVIAALEHQMDALADETET